MAFTASADKCDVVAGCYANESEIGPVAPCGSTGGIILGVELLTSIVDLAKEVDETFDLYDKYESGRCYEQATYHYDNGHYELAFFWANKSIEIYHLNSDSWTLRGASLYMLGRYSESIDSCNQSIRLNPDDARAWHTRGIALYRLGQYKEAVCSCNNALVIDPIDSKASEYRRLACAALGCYY